MKLTTLTKTLLLTIAFVGIGLAPTAQAAHATNFLDALQIEVDTRLDNLPDDATAEQRRALTAANKALTRNTRKLSTDLGALATAGTALAAGFPDDAALNTLQNDTVAAYSAEAQSQLDAVTAQIGSSTAPPALNNQLTQAQAALDRANDSANSISVRAKAVAFALNKIRVASILTTRLFKAPISLDEKVVVLRSRGNADIALNADHSYTIGDPSAPDETGTWDYVRASSNIGVVSLSGGQTLILKFNNATRGSFTEFVGADQTARGQFTVQNAP